MPQTQQMTLTVTTRRDDRTPAEMVQALGLTPSQAARLFNSYTLETALTTIREILNEGEGRDLPS